MAVFAPAPAPDSAAPCRVMVVDDSAIMRGLISRWLQEDAAVEVVASCFTGKHAIGSLPSVDPDVIVFDIEMPEMDGITALPELLRAVPEAKVLMASSLTRRNAEITLRALALAAADTVAKPEATRDPAAIAAFRRALVEKVQALGGGRRGRAARDTGTARPAQAAAASLALKPVSRAVPAVLGIGASTGGPQAPARLLGALAPRIQAPILVTQHMPPTFTGILAEHLGRAARRPCAEAGDGTALCSGHIYVAPGDFHMAVARGRNQPIVRLSQEPPENYCRPAVDPMFRSLAAEFGPAVLGIVLTGMGHDDREGARALIAAGGTVLAQDEATSVVWGTPGAVAQDGLCSGLLPIDSIAAAVDRIALGAGR